MKLTRLVEIAHAPGTPTRVLSEESVAMARELVARRQVELREAQERAWRENPTAAFDPVATAAHSGKSPCGCKEAKEQVASAPDAVILEVWRRAWAQLGDRVLSWLSR